MRWRLPPFLCAGDGPNTARKNTGGGMDFQTERRKNRMNTVRGLKTVIALQLERLRQLERAVPMRRLWTYLNKAGSRNLPNLPLECPDIDATVELSPEEYHHW